MQDRIKQMAEEADAHADAMDGSGKLGHKTWRQVREEYFAQAVASDIADWYAAEGWLLDEDDVPGAIRARFGIEGE